MVRRGTKDKGSRYFGPYAHAYAIRETLDSLLRTFPIRTCSDNKFRTHERLGRPCLLFHIEKCSGPCVGAVDHDDYDAPGRRAGRLPRRRHRAGHRSASRRRCASVGRRARVRAGGPAPRSADRGAQGHREAADGDRAGRGPRLLRPGRGRAGGRRPGLLRPPGPGGRPQGVHRRQGRGPRPRRQLVAQRPRAALRRGAAGRPAAGPRARRARGHRDLGSVAGRRSGRGETARDATRRSMPTSSGGRRPGATGSSAASTRPPGPGSGSRSGSPSGATSKALLEMVTRNAGEEFTRHRLKRAADHNARARALNALQDALDLPEAPLRIECYDMSHLQGTDYVGSHGRDGGRPAPAAGVPPLQGPHGRPERRLRGHGGGPDPPAHAPTWPSGTSRSTSAAGGSPTRPSSSSSTAARASSTWPCGSLEELGLEDEIPVAVAGQAVRGGLPPRPGRPGAHPPDVRGPLPAPADPGRGPPLRHHLPPQAPGQADDRVGARRHRRVSARPARSA